MGKVRAVKGVATPKKEKASANRKTLFVSKKIIIAIVCLVVALFIGYGINPIVSNYLTKSKSVLVVNTAIKKGEQITADKFKETEVLDVPISGGYAEAAEEVVGKWATVDMSAGDYIRYEKISETIPMPNPFFYELKDGEVAISCSTKTLASSVANKVAAGDVVTIYATFDDDEGNEVAATVFPSLKYVRVLSVTIGENETLKKEGEDGEEETISVVTFLCCPEQATILAGLEAKAQIQIGVVERGDTERATRLLQEQANIILAGERQGVEVAIVEDVAVDTVSEGE